jgi:beta-mannosidase
MLRKHYTFLILTLTLALMTNAMTAQSPNTISLNKGWRFAPANALPASSEGDLGKNIKTEGYPTNLPNTALNALHENSAIEDPFYRDNEKRLAWLERSEWVFEKTFDVPADALKSNHIELILKGLDTYADVYVNDNLVIKGSNMFLTYQKDIRNLLKETGNTLKIYFFSAVQKDKVRADNNFVDLPAIPENTRVFSRKAGFHYGWDWGPRLVTCGVQDASLHCWSDVKITDALFIKEGLNSQNATIKTKMTVQADHDMTTNISVSFDSTYNTTQKILLSAGENEVEMEVNIPNPKLWWTHNLGTPYLYNVKMSVGTEGGVKAEKNLKYGIRTIELVQEKDAKGESFFFRLNGLPIFSKGANMIPLHVFQERVKPEFQDHILQSAVDANMNMLRVWGGGIYQPDDFYQKCDEKGLLVWQDFMFACAMYPGDEVFLDNVRAEATEQVIRLRNHACLALWCGNNEINEAWHNWGWQPRFNPDQKDYIWKSYTDLFQKMLPNIVQEFGNGTQYHESSPRYGRYDKRSYTEGDNHDWFVWHDEKPFEHFEQKIPRFMSEYGFQSLPDWTTLLSFTKPEDRNLESEVMTIHQKHPKGNAIMKKYIAKDYPNPRSFEDFTYLSQLVQAEGISKAIEAQRRSMPHCMGSLYWQLNDVWPAASWSSMDNFGRWKALHYAAKSAYDNILISPVMTKDSFLVHIVNDYPTNIEGELFVYVTDFEGRTTFMEGRTKIIAANASQMAHGIALKTMLNEQNPRTAYISITFKPKDKTPITRTAYFVPPKELSLIKNAQIIKDISGTKDGYLIRLRSNVLVKNAYLSTTVEGHFDRNYLDILPGQDFVFHFKTKASMPEVLDNLKIKSLADVLITP